MLVTREMDYSLRILRALSGGEQLTSPQIAEREHLQPAMTYKLLKQLGKAKIVKGHRGHVGGYTLEIPCSSLTLYDLFHLLDASPLLTECIISGYSCENNSCGQCGVHREFARIQQQMELELKKKTLEELFSSKCS